MSCCCCYLVVNYVVVLVAVVAIVANGVREDSMAILATASDAKNIGITIYLMDTLVSSLPLHCLIYSFLVPLQFSTSSARIIYKFKIWRRLHSFKILIVFSFLSHTDSFIVP